VANSSRENDGGNKPIGHSMLVLSPNFPARNTSVLKKEGPKPLRHMYQKRSLCEHTCLFLLRE
jgi:hypothetical protein